LAEHFREAGQPERAAEFAAQAALRATHALAFDRAAQLYRIAIELRRGGAGVRTLYARLGEALANAGRGAEAAEAYLAAAEGATGAEALELRRLASSELLRAGHIEKGTAVIRDVLGAVGMKLAQTQRGALLSLLWRRGRVALRKLDIAERTAEAPPADLLMRIDVAYAVTSGLAMVDRVRAADFQSHMLLLALDAGEPTRLTRALCAEACFISTAGTPAARSTRRVLNALDGLTRRLDTPEARGLLHAASGIAAFQEGKWRSALEHCDQG
jgi:hypothetical protein